MNYKMLGFRPAKLVKMEILIAGQKRGSIFRIVAEDEAYGEGKKLVENASSFRPAIKISIFTNFAGLNPNIL